MDYQQIRYGVRGATAVITLNRPSVLNAWTPQMAREMRDAVRRAEADRDVVGIVLTGAGRGFCAGVDLTVLADAAGPDAEPADPDSKDALGSYSYLLEVKKPVLAAINGPVVGMAVPMVLACDLRFIAEDAPLSLLFSQRGLVAEWGVAWMLPRLVGSAVALDLLFSSRKISGKEAYELGLVNRALPAAHVLAAACAYVEELAERCSPTSIATMKQQVYGDLHDGLRRAELEAQHLIAKSMKHPDTTEGVTAYMEKRTPRFERVGTYSSSEVDRGGPDNERLGAW